MLGIRHMGLGGFAPLEAMAIEAELVVWEREGGYTQRENALRCGLLAFRPVGEAAAVATWLWLSLFAISVQGSRPWQYE